MKISSLEYFLIGLGAALGGITRVAIGKLLLTPVYGITIPIIFVNVLGCFLMGIAAASLSILPENFRFFLIPGFLGGFTTFSSFALEFGLLYEKNLYIDAIIYIGLSVFLSIIFFFIGLKIARLFL